MSDNNVSSYPIDFSSLQKGQRLSAAQLRDASGRIPGTQSYQLWCLSLISEIHKRRRMTARMDDDNILVLTDAEASQYNADHFIGYVRRANRSHTRLLAVDFSKLTDEQRREHEQRVVKGAYIVQAIRRARRELTAGPTQPPRVIADLSRRPPRQIMGTPAEAPTTTSV